MMPSSDGIYKYESGSWSEIHVDGPYVPTDDGIYVLYFRNRKCVACKSFDPIWMKFISMLDLDRYNVALIQCNEFFFDCQSSSASDTFIFYLVLSTPQVVLVVVENGLPVYIEREVGVLDEDRLRDFVLNVDSRRSMLTEEPSEEGEGIYIDFSTRDWKGIVNKIREMLFEGRNIEEVCDESGCRVVIS